MKLILKSITAAALTLPLSVMAANEVSSPGEQFGPPETVDFRNAQPLPLPSIPNTVSLLAPPLADPVPGPAGSSPQGSSDATYVNTGTEALGNFSDGSNVAASSGIGSQAYGTSNHPFNTTRVDYGVGKLSKKKPYRMSGKLFFNIGASGYICSASMIKPGIVLTAAHCVTSYGSNTFHTAFSFIPAYKNGDDPYGTWTYTDAYVLTSYLDGTGPCAVAGIVCEDDVAVIVLSPDGASNYAGNYTGWYGYGWNGYGFTGSGVADDNMTQITALGYPANLDNAQKNQRTDSHGYTDSALSNNTVIGSNATGGSSGGPWIVNIGKKANTSDTHGTDSANNTAVGATSWGYTDPAIKEQGASPFTSTNIVVLVDAACTAYPDRC